jgi:hypothetical protein
MYICTNHSRTKRNLRVVSIIKEHYSSETKSQEFYNVEILVLEKVRCLLPELGSYKCEIICHNVENLNKVVSLQNTKSL